MAEKVYNQVDVSQLECHFKWFNELNNEFNGQWLSGLLSKQLHYDLRNKVVVSEVDNSDEHDTEEDLQEQTVENHKTLTSHSLGHLSWYCTLIMRNIFEKKFAEAFQISKDLLGLEAVKNPSQPQIHNDTFSYVLLANQLNILKEWRSFGECPVDENEVVEIATKINFLKSCEKNDQAKALINVMKSNLSRDMQDSQLRVDFAKKATELNPLNAGWHECLYLALRHHRRSIDFSKPPSELEIDACKKAYELGSVEHPDNFSIGNVVQMAKLYGELLFTCRRGSSEHQQISDQAIKFTREAVQLKPDSKTLKMRLVSLLTGHQTYRRYPQEGYAEAEELVKECAVGRCGSEICHKLAKYYNNPKVAGYNTAKALEFFEKGLEAHIGNFPCFADMLRNTDFRLKSTTEILHKINTILDSQSKRNFKCQLMFIKGFFLWANDQEETLQLWLTAMEEATDLKINFIAQATHNFCYIKDGDSVQALNMMNNVKFFMSRRELANSEDQSFKKLKNIVNSIIEHFESRSRVHQDRPTIRNNVQNPNRGTNRNWRN